MSGSTIRFDAAPGEANTAVIVKQQPPNSYFVGDQSPGVKVTTADLPTMLVCQPTPPAALPAAILKLVKRHQSLKLTGAAKVRDSSGNRAKRTLRLRLKRP